MNPKPCSARPSRLSGDSQDPAHHRALLGWAGRCYEAGQPGPPSAILSYLGQPTDDDVASLISHFAYHAQSGWSPAPGVLELVGQLTPDQLRNVGQAVPDPLPEAWFNQHLLPHLFQLHAAHLVAMLSEEWWLASSLAWIAQQAP